MYAVLLSLALINVLHGDGQTTPDSQEVMGRWTSKSSTHR